ncbi:hypothetical protein TNCV_1187981 [Trichonephila clavipes]|nr:hypothetical protein TNCV_1187981 [Trichonephila clavipes]
MATHDYKRLHSVLGGVVHKSIGGNRLHLNYFRPQISMERFTNTELTDMHLIYGFSEGNARAEERLNCERHQQRDASDHRISQFVLIWIITRKKA